MSSPQAHRCWVCGGTGRPFRASTIREAVDARAMRITDSHYGQTAALSQCGTCGFLFADPVPHDDVVGLYRQMDDQPYQDSSTTRRSQMQQLLGLVAAARPRARTLLDIGAGTGLMVSEARARGFDAVGIEPSDWCVATAATANHVQLLHGTTGDWVGRLQRYDVVTMVDVIEHTTDPIAMLKDAAALLKPDGAMLIVTPDVSSFAARAMGSRWWHYRVAHVGYFNRRSMRRALQEVGLRVEREAYATWRFPASYLAERLAVYLPVFPIATVLRAAARARRIRAMHVNVNLRDSRAFIASSLSV